MACKLYLNQALKIKLKLKPIHTGSGRLPEEETFVVTGEVAIMESFQEEVAVELDLWEQGRFGH